MVVVLPMAGRGSRYANQGYDTPKPLINVAGKPMVLWALKSLEGMTYSKLVVVALREHEEKFGISALLKGHVRAPLEFVWLGDVTAGQLCTVLEARYLLPPLEDVLVAASDTLVEGNLGFDIATTNHGGLISVADLPGEQWSFARTDGAGNVVEVAEKKRISHHASTGLYYFRKAEDLIRFGQQMIDQKETTRGEYYLIPVYQKMIAAGISVGISSAHAMWDMGTPEAKRHFELHFTR
ncbi:MAG: hypothetical protein ACOYXA_01880 [Bacteroidota bacterium]